MSANAGNAAGTAPAVPDKGDWPRTEHGTVDWEAAFERGEHALIAMVEQTATQAGILACGMVIIRALFSRANDAEERVDYERQLNEAMAASFDGDDVESDDVRRARVTALLREIKEARIERANFHIARIKAGIDLIETDPLAEEAFRFANRAMWHQRILQSPPVIAARLSFQHKAWCLSWKNTGSVLRFLS